MKFANLICVIVAIVIAPVSAAAPPLATTQVEVFETEDAYASGFGSVISDITPVPSVGALGEDNFGQPKIAFLGCRFDIVLEQDNDELDSAVEAINRKIASSDAAVPSGVGYLRNPTPISIADPVTITKCDSDRHYPFFLFRHTTFLGSLVIEAVVFEYDDDSLQTFRTAIFNDDLEPTSITTAKVVAAAKGLYRIDFMSPEDIEAESDAGDTLFQGLVTLAPTLLGIPVP